MSKKADSPVGVPTAGNDRIDANAASRLLGDVRAMIEDTRGRVSGAVNSAMVMLYWSVGERVRRDILGNERAEYGKRVIEGLSQRLTVDYGRGFGRRNLFNMVRFAEVFPDGKIVHALSAQLSWTHFREIITIDEALKRDFYAELCRVERWSTRTLRKKISGMLYERTALSKKPEELAKQELAALREEDRLSPDLVFRDPYFLDFLGLHDSYSEKDLESAILRELEAFIMEVGTGFAFVARQKRITVDDEDYYLDLLFYHRTLRGLVAIELKLGQFRAADKGQMELYLRWLDRYERQPQEEQPLGLILCAGTSAEHVELMQLEGSGIRVAEYLTELPPREMLEEKLREAIAAARERLALPDAAPQKDE